MKHVKLLYKREAGILLSAFALTTAICTIATQDSLAAQSKILEKATQPVVTSVTTEPVTLASMPVTASEEGFAGFNGVELETSTTTGSEVAVSKVVEIPMDGVTLGLGLHKEYLDYNLRTINATEEYNNGKVENTIYLTSVSAKEIDDTRREMERKAKEEAERKAKEEAERKAEAERQAKLQAAREAEVGTVLDVPNVRSNFKAFMDYRCITSKTSMQWKLQHDGNAYTNEEGFRMYNGEYMVAVGSYYSQKIGTRLRVTLDTGKEIYCVVGDHKSDAHTDPMHQHRNGNVVEFIVDQSVIPSVCKKMGDMSHAPNANIEGKVVSIEKLESIFV